MRRPPHARPHAPRHPVPRPVDRAFERRLAALRADYLRIAPDPTLVARVRHRIDSLTRPHRVRTRRRALGFAASVLVAFCAGFFGSSGQLFGGRRGAAPTEAAHALGLAPASGAPPLLSPASRVLEPRAPEPRTTADRLRALLAPLGTSAATDAATLAAWRRATRDPDPSVRAVARALLRSADTGPEEERRTPPSTTLIRLDDPGDGSRAGGPAPPQAPADCGRAPSPPPPSGRSR